MLLLNELPVMLNEAQSQYHAVGSPSTMRTLTGGRLKFPAARLPFELFGSAEVGWGTFSTAAGPAASPLRVVIDISEADGSTRQKRRCAPTAPLQPRSSQSSMGIAEIGAGCESLWWTNHRRIVSWLAPYKAFGPDNIAMAELPRNF